MTGSVGEDDLDRLIREVEAAGGAPFDDDVAVMLVSAAATQRPSYPPRRRLLRARWPEPADQIAQPGSGRWSPE